MLLKRASVIAATVSVGLTMAGCAGDGTFAGFGAAEPPTATAALPEKPKPKVDPACVNLASQIETIRKEGTIERLEKASAGTGASVQVKRAALTKQAELNKLHADFQARCSSVTAARQVQASAAPAAAPKTPPAAAVKALSSAPPVAGATKAVATKAATAANPAAATAAQAPDQAKKSE